MTRRTARADRDQARTGRRDRVDILLARYARHAPAEAALLRTLVEAEITEADRFRREAGGQQAAVRREQQRVVAAEAAIVEAEQRAEAAEQALAAVEAAAREAADDLAESVAHAATEQQAQEQRAALLRVLTIRNATRGNRQ